MRRLLRLPPSDPVSAEVSIFFAKTFGENTSFRSGQRAILFEIWLIFLKGLGSILTILANAPDKFLVPGHLNFLPDAFSSSGKFASFARSPSTGQMKKAKFYSRT